ncbi:MAG: RNA polymerase sigma factor [Acidobacteria bacterium]|nr:RNA polymerase sigma factor [Acidobacteriota bacterium]
MTDSDLVTRARAGAEDAWAELVHRHHGAVFRAAHAALVSRAEADDAAQEAWIAAWQALAAFRGQSSFRTWLLTIAWRKALDRRRSVVGWLRMLRVDDAADPEDRATIELVSTEADAESDVLDQAARARVKRLVKGLPRAHRDALLLMATQDLPYAEAAALLGVPVGTLKWRVSDARRMLRARLARP